MHAARLSLLLLFAVVVVVVALKVELFL